MKKVVIDASFLLAVLLPDERPQKKFKKILDDYAEGKLEFLAPNLIKYEVTNGIKSAVLRKRIDRKIGAELVEILDEFEIKTFTTNYSRVFQLGLKYKLSAYDAAYLSLAKDKKVELLSLDKKLSSLAG
jgi:predicted nucleic acid-binding protein